MKLYATTTSERASKGQGGQYLIIDVTNDKKEKILNLHIYQGERGYIMRGSNYGMYKIEINEVKGNKQKGEYHCEKHAWHCSGDGSYPCPHH